MKIKVGHPRSRYRVLTSLGSLLAFLAVSTGAGGFRLSARTQAAQEQPPEKTAEQQFKNIQVFQGLPASQVIPAMYYMEAALGVQCSYCHVEKGFDKDDKEEKASARKMIKMVRDINQANFDGRNEVTCNTCHHGQAHPASVPALAEISSKVPAAQPAQPERRSSEPLPSVDQVFEKYIQSIGGKDALEKIETRVMKGTRTASEGWSAPVEVYQKAPNKLLLTLQSNVAFRTGFDGTEGWNQSSHGLHKIEGANLSRMKREAVLSRSLKLRQEYQNLRVIGKQAIGDRETYVVQGVAIGEKQPERLFFDTQSGLLLRIYSREATPLGPLPSETDFDDYREVDGIKLPFTVLRLSADRSYKDVFAQISQNVPVDDAKFETPTEPTK